MTRLMVLPDDLDMTSPGRRDYWVRFEHPSIWGAELVPVTVLIGPEATEGHGLLAIGSVHGDEYEGPVALKNILRDISLSDIRGRIIIVPVINVAAFRAGQRDTPVDGGNLNRAFPGNCAGSLTQRFAAFVSEHLFPQVDIVCDLHAGGAVARFPLLMSFHHVADPEQAQRMEEIARGFGAPFTMIYQDQTPGLLTSTAERLRKITVGGELGWGETLHPCGIAAAQRGVLAAAISADYCKAVPLPTPTCPSNQQQLIDASANTCTHFAVRDGLFEPAVELGATAKTDDVIGYLHDFHRIDDAPLAIHAQSDGFVMSLPMNSRIQQGQILSIIGPAVSWSHS